MAVPIHMHRSVMAAEVMRAAQAVPPEHRRGLLVDGTLGEAGHVRLFRRLFEAPILGCDRDPEMLARARRRLELGPGGAGRVRLVESPFGEIAALLGEADSRAWFILLDLGVSMFHFRGAERGFSYSDETLDMRLSPGLERTAADLVNELPADELADLFYKYGEERGSRRVARRIVEQRPIRSARQLAELTAGALSTGAGRGAGPHPARRVFQALRIAVNEELQQLETALETLPGCLGPGGRLAIISFHSLEDRLVKNAFRALGDRGRAPAGTVASWKDKQRAARRSPEGESRDFWLRTPRPLLPTEREIRRNPAARSAKLRILERKLPDT